MPTRETGVKPRWHRVVLKLSGEALLSSASDETINTSTVRRLANEIGEARASWTSRLPSSSGAATSAWHDRCRPRHGPGNLGIMGMSGRSSTPLPSKTGWSESVSDKSALGHPHGRGLRALHPSSCHSTPGKGPGRHFARAVAAVFHYGHSPPPWCGRDRGGRDTKRHPLRRGRCLRRGAATTPAPLVIGDRVHGGRIARPPGDGPHRHHVLS